MNSKFIFIGLFFTSILTLSSQIIDSSLSLQFPSHIHRQNANLSLADSAYNAYFSGKSFSKGDGHKVYERWRWRAAQHTNSAGMVEYPTEIAKDLVPAPKFNNGGMQTPGASPCPQNGRWQHIGLDKNAGNQGIQPTGVGRIADIAFHPTDSNTFWACAPQGGIWKTTDHGSSWKSIFNSSSGFSTIGVSCMVASYNNPDTIYAGTGDRDAGDAPGIGVIASFNGGVTWVTRNTGITGVTVSKIIMHPKNSKILIIATNGALYRTTDGGVSWTNVTPSGFSGLPFFDLVFHPLNPNLVFATSYYYFLRSTNGGTSFTQITSGLPSASGYRAAIAVTKANRSYVYMLACNSTYGFLGLYRSTDSGATFTTRSTTPNILGSTSTGAGSTGQGWYDIDIAANPLNAEEIVVGGIITWRSTNGGTSWTVSSHWYGDAAENVHADHHCLDWSKSGYRLFDCNDGGLYYMNRSNLRYFNISDGLSPSQMYRITVAKNIEHLADAGLQDNGHFQFDGDEFVFNNGGDGMDGVIDPTDGTYAYVASQYGNINRYVNKTGYYPVGGNGVNGINEQGPWVTPFVLQEGTPTTMFAGYKNIWRSTNVRNSPPSWTNLTAWNVEIRHIENSMAKNSILYVVRSDNTLWRTHNANASAPTFTNISSTLPGTVGTVNWIEAHHKDSNIVYMCGTGGIFKSRNKGSTWTNITGTLSGVGNYKCIYIDTSASNDNLYLGTEKGVYFRDTASIPWTDYNNQFPIWSDVTDLDIYYSPKGKNYSRLYAGTYGRGLWKSPLYDPGTATPVANFYSQDSVFVQGGTTVLHEICENTTTSFKWRIYPNSGFSFVNGTDTTSQHPEIKFTTSGIYDVVLVASNCQGTNQIKAIGDIKVFPSPAAAFCVNTTTYHTANLNYTTSPNPVGNVRIAFADNAHQSGGYFDDGEYSNYAADKIFRIKPSTTYSIALRTGWNASTNNVRLFIDYNNNGKFENFKSEALGSTGGSGNRTLSFTTPATITKNQGMRMRILTDNTTMDTNACRNLTWGEGEDYTVVYDKPEPFFKASNLAPCVNTAITFTDTSKGLIYSYKWDFGSGASPATATGKGPHNVTYTTTGAKNIKLKLNGTDSLVKSSYITVSNSASVSIQLKSGTNPACAGSSVTIAARSASSLSGFSFQWYKAGSLMTGKTDSVLTLTNITSADAASYTVNITNGSCSSTSTGYSITVNPKPVVSFTETVNQRCKKWNSFSYTNTSSISSGSISAYSWKVGSTNYSTTNVTNHKFPDSGTFNVKLIATSAAGCKDSSSIQSIVRLNSTVAFAVNDTDQCFKVHNFVFSNTSSSIYGAVSSLWTFSDGATSVITSPSKTFATAGSSHFARLRITSTYCTDTLQKPLTLYTMPVPSFTLVSNTEQCSKYAKLIATNTSTTGNGGANSYVWKISNGATSSSTNLSYSIPSTGSYTFKLIVTSALGCKDSASSANTNVQQTPTPNFSINATPQCNTGHSFNFTNTSTGASTYNWSLGDATSASTTNITGKTYAATGTYNVQLISIAGSGLLCRDTIVKSVSVNPNSSPNFTINNASQCLRGNSFTYTNTSTVASGTLTYLWRFGDGTTSTSTNPSKTYTTAGTFTVKLIVTTNNGCKDSISKTVTTIDVAKTKFAVNDSDQCFTGHNFSFTNQTTFSGGYSLNWNFGDGTTSVATNPSKTYTAVGIYTVQLISTTTANSCKDTFNKPVRVYAMPVPTFSVNNAAQCNRTDKFIITNNTTISQGTFTNAWRFGDGTNSTASAPTKSYTNSGTYKIVLTTTSNFGCIDSTNTTVTVYPSANLKFTVNDTDQCKTNNSFVFTNSSTLSSGTITYNWTFGNGSSSTATSPTYTYPNFGIYTVMLTSNTNNNCKDTVSKPVRVYAMPVPAFTVNSATQCSRYNKFTITNSTTIGEGSFSNFWRLGDGSNSSASAPSKTYSGTGNFKIVLTATSNFGCVDSTNTTVTVNPNANLKFSVNDTDQCKTNNSFVFTNNSTLSSGTLTYSWNFGNGNTSTTTSPTYTYPTHGIYTVTLTSNTNNNCKDTVTKPVRVYAMPVPAFTVNNATQCWRYNKFNLTNTTSIAEGTFTNLWRFSDGTNATSLSPAKTYTNPGTYKIVLRTTSNFACVDSANTTVTVNPNASLKFKVNDTDQCLTNNSFVFTNNSSISAGTLSYNWTFGNGNGSAAVSPAYTYPAFGIYTTTLISTSNNNCKDTLTKPVRVYAMPAVGFSVNTLNQCLKGNSFTFTNTSSIAQGTFSNLWKLGDGTTATSANVTKKYNNDGSYTIKLIVTSNYACSDSSNNTVNVYPQTKMKITVNDSDQCKTNNSFVFTNNSTINSGTTAYNWNFGDATTSNLAAPAKSYANFGIYNVSIFANSNLGCKDTIIKKVRVYAMPVPAFTINKGQQCFKWHKFVETNNSSIGEGTFSTKWDNGDGSTASALNNNKIYSLFGNYSVKMVLTSNFGCTDSLSKNIRINPSPNVNFSANPNQSCENQSITFNNGSSIANGNITYLWNFGDGNTSTTVSPTKLYTLMGNKNILLIATSDSLCKDSASSTYNVASNPAVNFVFNPTTGCAKQTEFTFTSTSTNADGSSINLSWDFGDTTTASTNSAKHIFNYAKTYPVKLTVASARCTSNFTKNITVAPRVFATFIGTNINKETKKLVALDTVISGYSYNWKISDKTSYNNKIVVHNFKTNDSFSVKLIVNNLIGCADSTVQWFKVKSPNYLQQNNGLNFFIYPNPTDGKFTYKFELKEKETISIRLLTIEGQTILKEDWGVLEPGVYYKEIDMAELKLSRGSYPFEIKSSKEKLSTVIIYAVKK